MKFVAAAAGDLVPVHSPKFGDFVTISLLKGRVNGVPLDLELSVTQTQLNVGVWKSGSTSLWMDTEAENRELPEKLQYLLDQHGMDVLTSTVFASDLIHSLPTCKAELVPAVKVLRQNGLEALPAVMASLDYWVSRLNNELTHHFEA